MKKLLVITLALSVAGLAVASTLAVPWFVDTGSAAGKVPRDTAGVSGFVYLHNNLSTVLTCSIEYFTMEGAGIGPEAPDNTFVIQANATIAFRPVASDPVFDPDTGDYIPGGQESNDAGWLVPDRPMDTSIPGNEDARANGSAVITWLGGPGDVQGVYIQHQTANRGGEDRIISFAHLLPTGV